MQLTKILEKDILKRYDKWIYSYLNGDVATYDSFFDDAYHFIGSTNNEEFLTRKDTTNFFKKTVKQLAGKTDLRNDTKTIERFDNLIFITHAFDAWFLNGKEWTYYGRFRFSSVMQKKEKDWKFIYQHFSTTDSKTDDGETIGFDKVNAENQELREAIKRRTVELEEKNRKLKVEGTLDRIRAQAMAMTKSSDLLDIVVTMRTEFIKLGHEAHYFWHMMWLPETYEKAMTSGDGSKIGFVMELPRHIHGNIPLLSKWEKSKKPTIVYAMNAEEAVDYVDKMVALGDFQNIDPQAPSDADIRHIGGLTFIMARTSHGEIGYSLPGVVKNPPKEDIDILVKFAGAFDLAHQRFLDLQKAEKQAKETLTELSLERIRSRVAEMKVSSDLFDIVVTMRNEFISLGHEADYFWHMKWLKDSYEMSMTAEDGGRLGMVITVPKFVHKQIKGLHKWEKSNSPYFVLALNGKEAWDYIENMNTYGKYKLVDPHAPTEEDILHIGGLTFIIARTTHGEIGFSLAGEVPDPPKKSIEILIRFAKVFDLAYKRFEDLQKAEIQARETQIELALEKVRSRTMAMKHSDELAETSYLLDQQVRALGIKTWGCAFNIYGENESTEWFGNEAGVLPTYTVPREGIFKDYYQKGKKGESLIIKEFSGKACVDHYEYMSSLPVIGDVLKNLKKANNGFPTYQIDHVVYFKYGYWLFITKEHVPESHDIFKRFAKVFEQTYTRFLDLKKAEEQAKEAQIETALERVRSRSMAMHQSNEIGDVAFVLFQQLKSLGGELWGTGFGFCEKDSDDEYWFANEKGIMPQLKIPHTVDPIHKQMHEGWNKNLELFSIAKDGKELKEHYKYMLTVPDVKPIFQGILDDGIAFPKWQKWHAAYFKYGYLLVITTEIYEDEDVFKRFAKVFEQAYTRFLDLQKAEAQAREAQIEAALERVRSRSMAMQKSSELLEAGELLCNEITKLGIDCFTSGYVLMDDKEDIGWNYTPNPSTGKILGQPIGIPHKQTPPMRKIIAGWKKQDPLCVIELTKKQTIAHQTFVAEKGIDFPFSVKELVEISPKEIVIHAFNFNQGYLLIIGGKKLVKSQIEVMLRFTRVFQQTYTRFLDLKNAESQARESKIQLALERVRAKTMAMQHSDELREVVLEIYQQLQVLDFETQACNIIIVDKVTKDMHYWVTGFTQDLYPESYHVPNLNHPYTESLFKAWQEGIKYQVFTWEGKEKIEFDKLFFSKTDFKKTPKEAQEMMKSLKSISLSTAFSSSGLLQVIGPTPLNEDKAIILQRFAKVFNQTYTRFLDLQKAEAQARESQIENALEKVRSRSLAMHKPDELQEVVATVAEKLHELGVIYDAGGVILCTYFPDNKDVVHWIAVDDFSTSGRYFVPYFNSPIFSEAWDSKDKGDAFFSKEFSVEAKNDFFNQAFEKSDYRHFPDDYKQHVLQADKHRLSAAWSKNSAILIPSLSGAVPSEGDAEIMKRFAKVFEQAYIRFMDLEKAETQTRQAKIEGALERVRARALAMQKPEELKQVADVLRTEMGLLGIEELETCSIYINDNETKKTECWYALKDISSKNKKLVNDHFHLNLKDTWVGKKMLQFYKTKDKQTSIVMTGKNRKEWIDYCEKHSRPFKGYYGEEIPDRTYHLYKFSHGAIGVATASNISDENWNLLKRAATTFSLAYSRFKDLTQARMDLLKLKEEKKRAEDALTELQLTQSQLIQSEKMASLGELTAGIAHEIQNPLNFVNNFSEVSKELLDEMLEELSLIHI